MTAPLMPKATAVWLIENTSLTFEQIARFCELHVLEVQAIADNESALRMVGFDPIASGQLTQLEIQRCEADPQQSLQLKPAISPESVLKKKKSRYMPLSKRQERPDAIAWLIKFCPGVPDMQICRLLGTTKTTIQAIRSRTHWNSANIKPRNPAQIGLCSQQEIDALIANYSSQTDAPEMEPETFAAP